MTIPPLSLGIIKGAEWLKALHAEMFTYGQAHGYMNKNAEHTSVHALAGRLQAGPSGNLELTVPSSLIKGVFDALDEPGAEFVVRNNRTECAIKVMTKEEVDKLGGVSHISERGHSYHYTLGPIVELPATGDYDKLWAISIKSNDLEDIRKSYGLETSPQLGFYIPVGCKKKRVTEDNAVSKLAGDTEPKKELVRIKLDDNDGKSLTHHYLTAKKWDYPAGKVEPNEDRDDAAVRELRERTGHHIDKSKLKYNGHSDGFHQYSGALSDVSKIDPAHYETGEPRQLSWKKEAGVYTASGDKVQGVGLRKMYHSLLEEQGLPGLGVNNEDTGDVELSFDGDEAKRQEVFNQLGSRVQAKTGHPVTFAPVDIPQSSVPVSLSNKDTERLNAIHHLAYRMSNMYDPADPLLDSNDNFKQKLADRFRLQVNQRGLKGTVPSRAAEQLLGTRPMYEGMMPARRTRSEEEALSDMAEEQKRRLMKALSGGRGFLAPNESGISKLAGLLKSAGETFKYSDKVGVDPEPKREVPAPVPQFYPPGSSTVPAIPKLAPTAPKPSITSTSFSPLQPSNTGTPEFHPGPDYERGDYQRQLQGQSSASKYKPLPEEAPLGNASMDFSYLAAPFASKSLRSLWDISNLKEVKAMPSVKYGLPALGVTSAVAAAIPGAKTTYDAIARAPQDILDTIYRGAGIPRIGKNSRRSSADAGTLLGTRLGSAPRAENIKVPELKEVPFSIIGKDNSTVSFAKDLGLDVGKQVLSNALHQGLKSYSTSKEGPKGPFGITPSAQLSDAAARAAAAAAAEYTDKAGPDYAEAYQRHLNEFLKVNKGETAVDTTGLSDPLLSQGNKDRLNTLSAIRRMPLPFELKGNPHFLKEVMDKYTPNLGEAAWDLVFKRRNDAANSAAFNDKLKEIGSTPPHYRDLGKKPTNPVITEQPRLRKEMSEGASRLGKEISDSLIPPRPKGQQPPAMFPQIRKIIEDLGDAAMKTNKSAGVTEGEDTPPPIEPISLPPHSPPSGMPAPSIPQGTDFNAMWDKWKKSNPKDVRGNGAKIPTEPGMPLYTYPSGTQRLGTLKFDNSTLNNPNLDGQYTPGSYLAANISPGADSGPGHFRISAHGRGGYAEKGLEGQGGYEIDNPGNKGISLSPLYRENLPAFMKGQNPSTLMAQSCNSQGGCTPATYGSLFNDLKTPGTKTNLNKVVMTPPGYYATATSDPNQPEGGSAGDPYGGWPDRHTLPQYQEHGYPYHEYTLPAGRDATNNNHWQDMGIYTDARQSRPFEGFKGEVLELTKHLSQGGNLKGYLDKVERINNNPDATVHNMVGSINARMGGSAAVAATRSIPEIISSIGWNNHLRAMQDRSQRKLSKTPAVQTPGLYPGVPIN